MFNSKNTKKQGDIGLGRAISYFTKIGYTVSIPLTDSQDYDLIVDDNLGHIYRVQVKTTSYKRNKYYIVSLTIKGGNRSSIGKVKAFDKSRVDIVYILTEENREYIIPTNELDVKSTIILAEKYDKYMG